MMNYLVDLQEKPREIEIGPNGMSIDLLRAVYRNPSIPLPVRIRCAVAALPHEVPASKWRPRSMSNHSLRLLEARIKKFEAMNGQTKTQVIDHPQIEAPKPLPRIADRRFRRMWAPV
jgi:hypothetical protein